MNGKYKDLAATLVQKIIEFGADRFVVSDVEDAIDAAVTEAVAAERRNFESAIKAYFDNARGAR